MRWLWSLTTCSLHKFCVIKWEADKQSMCETFSTSVCVCVLACVSVCVCWCVCVCVCGQLQVQQAAQAPHSSSLVLTAEGPASSSSLSTSFHPLSISIPSSIAASLLTVATHISILAFLTSWSSPFPPNISLLDSRLPPSGLVLSVPLFLLHLSASQRLLLPHHPSSGSTSVLQMFPSPSTRVNISVASWCLYVHYSGLCYCNVSPLRYKGIQWWSDSSVIYLLVRARYTIIRCTGRRMSTLSKALTQVHLGHIQIQFCYFHGGKKWSLQ